MKTVKVTSLVALLILFISGCNIKTHHGMHTNSNEKKKDTTFLNLEKPHFSSESEPIKRIINRNKKYWRCFEAAYKAGHTRALEYMLHNDILTTYLFGIMDRPSIKRKEEAFLKRFMPFYNSFNLNGIENTLELEHIPVSTQNSSKFFDSIMDTNNTGLVIFSYLKEKDIQCNLSLVNKGTKDRVDTYHKIPYPGSKSIEEIKKIRKKAYDKALVKKILDTFPEYCPSEKDICAIWVDKKSVDPKFQDKFLSPLGSMYVKKMILNNDLLLKKAFHKNPIIVLAMGMSLMKGDKRRALILEHIAEFFRKPIYVMAKDWAEKSKEGGCDLEFRFPTWDTNQYLDYEIYQYLESSKRSS